MTDLVEMLECHSTTTEPEHRHYCEHCGGVWSHCDEFCEGPRFSGYHLASFGCPFCVER